MFEDLAGRVAVVTGGARGLGLSMARALARHGVNVGLVDLLVQQLTGPVKFTQAVRGLIQEGVELFVEIGPGQVLSGLLRRCDRSLKAVSVGDPESLRRLQEGLSAA